VNEIDALLDHLAAALRGPRHTRQRLVAEVAAHLADALAEERAAGCDERAAVEAVLDRFGDVRKTAAAWNRDQARRRSATRRNALLIAVAAVAAGALGVTQYASGKPTPEPQRCVGHQGAACRDLP
jgi:hypothetical protein